MITGTGSAILIYNDVIICGDNPDSFHSNVLMI